MIQAIRKQKNKKGFTLIELIVVIAIIGILAAVLLPQFLGFTDRAREGTAVSGAKEMLTALQTVYSLDGAGAIDDSNAAASLATIKTYIPVLKENALDAAPTTATALPKGQCSLGKITVGTGGEVGLLTFEYYQNIDGNIFTVKVVKSVVDTAITSTKAS